MFQEAVLRHHSEHLANSFSQRICKLNLAVNELQVALGLGKQVSRRKFCTVSSGLIQTFVPHLLMDKITRIEYVYMT